jgi:hypothetical protein
MPIPVTYLISYHSLLSEREMQSQELTLQYESKRPNHISPLSQSITEEIIDIPNDESQNKSSYSSQKSSVDLLVSLRYSIRGFRESTYKDEIHGYAREEDTAKS